MSFEMQHCIMRASIFLFSSDSEDIINDMWISGKDSGKELEPLNM
jgi:hypothetical protein